MRSRRILETVAIVASSNLLRNADDDRTAMVFDEAIRGRTDRVLYKLVKPAE